MKLKLLFFPAILIISISIFFGFIVPDWNLVRENADNITKKENRISQLENKSSNIKKLEQDLKNHQDDENLLYMFLPTEVNQEYIVNNVGRIADSAGVSVSELSFSEDKGETKDSGTVRAREKVFQQDPQEIELDPTGLELATVENNPELQRVIVNVSLAGPYDSIKAFIKEVETMDVMADVTGAELSRIESEDGGQNIISGDLRVAVYFMDRKTSSGEYSDKFLESASFDYKFAEIIKENISKRSVQIDIEGAGNNNPFVLSGSPQPIEVPEPVLEPEF